MFVLAYKKSDTESSETKSLSVSARVFDLELNCLPIFEPGESEPVHEIRISQKKSAEMRHPLVITRKLQYFTVLFKGFENQYYDNGGSKKPKDNYLLIQSSGPEVKQNPDPRPQWPHWVQLMKGVGNPGEFGYYGTTVSLNSDYRKMHKD